MNVLQTQTDLGQANMTGAMAAFGVGQPSVTLTIRLIMQGKEVGSIIGKKGDNIKRFREESGAKITISDGSCPERIVTVTGSTEAILKAFALISRKFEEVSNLGGWLDMDPSGLNPLVQSHSQLSLSSVGTTGNGQNGKSNCSLSSAASLMGQAPVTLKLIVPASQCGSLIGKGGSKIKEIRETTGASIQVASEMLPNSTERAVTLSGTAESITKSIYQICCVMLESPPKGPTIPYRPKPAMPPVFFANGQAYTIQGQFAIPHPDAFGASLPSPTPYFETAAQSCALQHQAAAAFLSQHFNHLSQQQQLASATGLGSSGHHSSSAASAASAGHSPNISVPVSGHHHLGSSSSPSSAGSGMHGSDSQQGSPPQANGLNGAAGFLDFASPAAAQFATNSGFLTKLHRLALQHAPLLPGHAGVGSLSPQATLATLANSAASLGHAATAAAAANAGVVPTLTTEMSIPNDIIGSVIGKGGAKINEIRQLSGATIKINNSEEGSKDRTVLISGTPEAINLAQYLIATRMLNSSQLSPTYGPGSNGGTGNTAGSSSTPSSSGSSTAGGTNSYGQPSQQQLQYAMLYKNYLQPYLQQQYNAYYANNGQPIPSVGNASGPHYYSNTSGSAVQHASYVNATGTAGSSSRSSSNSSSEAITGNAVAGHIGHHQHHQLYKSDAHSTHSNASTALMSEASPSHHQGHHGHQQYDYEPIYHHHQLMNTASSATNYAPSIASMARY